LRVAARVRAGGAGPSKGARRDVYTMLYRAVYTMLYRAVYTMIYRAVYTMLYRAVYTMLYRAVYTTLRRACFEERAVFTPGTSLVTRLVTRAS
jgi:hypothetical protein